MNAGCGIAGNERGRMTNNTRIGQEKYLTWLQNFWRRIANANAYGTDFQVPIETAAFLNGKSGVGHFVMASRDLTGVVDNGAGGGEGSADNQGSGESKKESNGNDSDQDSSGQQEVTGEQKKSNDNVSDGEGRTAPPFIVAVVCTEKQSQS